jgi:hypothetical protein
MATLPMVRVFLLSFFITPNVVKVVYDYLNASSTWKKKPLFPFALLPKFLADFT